jgi:hypothetical protein
MPLQPDFRLFLNRDEIVSSKESVDRVVRFDVKELPKKRLDSITKKTGETWSAVETGLCADSFPAGICGSVMVTEESLHVGKSADLGRSHGFFIRVRGRLINEEDPLFGLSPLSYQTFNRFRADIAVDDLDDAVTAPREGIGESPLKQKVMPLLEELFYEARERYEAHLEAQDEKEKRRREHERTYVPTRLMEHPIADVLSLPSSEVKQGAEADESWFYLEVGREQDMGTLAQTLYTQRRTGKYKYCYTNAGGSDRLVRFNPEESTFYLNADHDLVLAYYDDPRARVLLEDLVTAEAILEVYLREHGMPPHVVGEVLERRDSLLRGLANEHVFSLTAISRSLRDSASDEHDLEVALVAAARALGFVAKHIGGSGEPDGIGRFIDYPAGERKITLEAKASQGLPTLSQLDFAGLKEHMARYEANGCLLVATGYPGEGKGDGSAVSQRAKENGISCWTVGQLAGVVGAVETRHIGAQEVLDIVLRQFSPDDVGAAVEKLLSEPRWEHRSLYAAVLEALRDLGGRLPDRARTISHIATEVTRKPEFAGALEQDVHTAVGELAAASQGALLLRDDRVIVNASLDEIERRLSGLTGNGGEPRRGGTFRDSTEGS